MVKARTDYSENIVGVDMETEHRYTVPCNICDDGGAWRLMDELETAGFYFKMENVSKHPFKGNRVHGVGLWGPIFDWEGIPSVLVAPDNSGRFSDPVLTKKLRQAEDAIITS